MNDLILQRPHSTAIHSSFKKWILNRIEINVTTTDRAGWYCATLNAYLSFSVPKMDARYSAMSTVRYPN